MLTSRHCEKSFRVIGQVIPELWAGRTRATRTQVFRAGFIDDIKD